MAKNKDMLWQIGEKLVIARQKAGMTQEHLAELAELQSNSIHRYEAGEREMGFTVAVRISKALRIPMKELMPDEYIERSIGAVAEEELLEVFYQLDKPDQMAMLRQMKALILMGNAQ